MPDQHFFKAHFSWGPFPSPTYLIIQNFSKSLPKIKEGNHSFPAKGPLMSTVHTYGKKEENQPELILNS